MIAIVPATELDLGPILELLRQSRLPAAGIADHLSSALVAREGDRVIGSAALELYGTAALLRSVAVEADRRGKGLGRKLTTAAMALARDRGVRTVYLLTDTAADFFAAMGFTREAREAVGPAVRQSIEFREACPASAVCMVFSLDGHPGLPQAHPS